MNNRVSLIAQDVPIRTYKQSSHKESEKQQSGSTTTYENLDEH